MIVILFKIFYGHLFYIKRMPIYLTPFWIANYNDINISKEQISYF